MLAANFDEIAYFSIWIFNARAAISYVDKYAFSSFVVFDLDCSTNAKHVVGSLFLHLVLESDFFLSVHFANFFHFFKREKFVDSHSSQFLHFEIIMLKLSRKNV